MRPTTAPTMTRSNAATCEGLRLASGNRVPRPEPGQAWASENRRARLARPSGNRGPCTASCTAADSSPQKAAPSGGCGGVGPGDSGAGAGPRRRENSGRSLGRRRGLRPRRAGPRASESGAPGCPASTGKTPKGTSSSRDPIQSPGKGTTLSSAFDLPSSLSDPSVSTPFQVLFHDRDVDVLLTR